MQVLFAHLIVPNRL